MKTALTSKDSFAILAEIEAEIKKRLESSNPDGWDNVNALEEKRRQALLNLVPEVGTKGSIVYYSDIRAVTVVEVTNNGRRVGVKFNKTKCLDWFGNKYEILPELEDGDRVRYFTKRRSGRWRAEGCPDKPDNIELCIHVHMHSIDPSF